MAVADLRIHDTLQALSDRVAAAISGSLVDAVTQRGRCSLLLAGGGTPRAAYELLAMRYRDDVPWDQVHVFWGDERFLPPHDPRSNVRMAREALLDRVPSPPANVHPIPTELPSADAAALRYEDTLRAHFSEDRPAFDLVLLGLGADAHTASIFPRSPALDPTDRWVMAVTAPVEPALRVTLTMQALTAAAKVFVLVAGSEKAVALRRALDPASDPKRYPAAALRGSGGRVTWWADRAAASDSGR
jgi:6-phosphogluconolactonase